MVDYLSLVISKEEVENQNYSNILQSLNSLIENPDQAKRFKENVDLAFSGYEEDSRELFEIEEVREFVFNLDDKFPYWLFFLTKFGTGLQCIFLCMMPPFLTEKAKAEIYPQRLSDLLMNRWFPALNHICAFSGTNEAELEDLSERAVIYLTEGVFEL